MSDSALVSSATRGKCLVTEGSYLQQDQANGGASLSSIPGTLVLCLNPRRRWRETSAHQWSEDLLTAEAALGLVKQSLFPDGIIWSPFARAASKERAASALPAAHLANTDASLQTVSTTGQKGRGCTNHLQHGSLITVQSLRVSGVQAHKGWVGCPGVSKGPNRWVGLTGM